MRKLVIALCLISLTSVLWADFNKTSGLIDIPTARILPHLGYRIGLDGSIAIDPDNSVQVTEENIHAAVGFNDRVETYLDIYTFSKFTAAVGFCHRFYDTDRLSLGWGMHTISYDTDVSEIGHGDSANFKDELYYSGEYEKPFELGSGFIVATYRPQEKVGLTLGIGRGDFVGYGPHSRYFNTNFYHKKGGDWALGAFVGAEYRPIEQLSLMFDIDARDFNLGLCGYYGPVEIGLALTKIEHILWSEDLSPRIVGSLSYLKAKEPSKSGVIAGTVVDRDNAAPLAAEVGFLHSDIPKMLTRAEIGTFKFGGLRPGIYEIYARAEGFTDVKKKVKISPGKTIYVDFELQKKLPKTGDIYGKVFDLKTGKPVVARLKIENLKRTTQTNATGIFQFNRLEPAIYNIEAEADGYEPGVYPAVVNANERTEVEIGMIKPGMVITIKGIQFDFNKSTIKPESYPILDQAAAILANHPEIRVEIQGHTDSVGSDSYNLKLSNARAGSVRDYLIRRHEIEASKLVARGYGERRPIASNKTNEGRAQNRRVDFLILK